MFCETEACRLEYLIIFVPSWPPSYWVTDLCAVVAWILMMGRHQLKKRVYEVNDLRLVSMAPKLKEKTNIQPISCLCFIAFNPVLRRTQYLVALV